MFDYLSTERLNEIRETVRALALDIKRTDRRESSDLFEVEFMLTTVIELRTASQATNTRNPHIDDVAWNNDKDIDLCG